MNQLRSSSISGEETDYFGLIPVDLFISNILSRLPVKSIAQCRCVSKLWSSLIRRPNYNLLFPIKSSAPPRILFTFEYKGELFIYSSPQPHNPDEKTSLAATLHHRKRVSKFSIYCPPVGVLVCHQQYQKNPSAVVVVSNPITGEFLALPTQRMNETKSEGLKENLVRSYFAIGYDPINKQLKILCIPYVSATYTSIFSGYQVLTLVTGTKNLLWRKIPCSKIHYHLGYDDDKTICISGVLYYPAVFQKGTGSTILCVTIACFDVRSEKYSFTNIDQDMEGMMMTSCTYTLIDYKGKLGACDYDIYHNRLQLWVLEDAKKHEWSKLIYQMPPFPDDPIYLRPAGGMISSCEILLYPTYTHDAFFIFYYNLESNILTRVNLKVPIFFSECRVHVFANYIEDVKLM